MAAAVTYSFPMMSPPEIATCLEEIGIPFGEAALAKPEPEPVAKLFEALVMSLVGVSRDELQQPVFSALDALAYPELHEDSIGVITFTRHLYRLMRTAGVHDFVMRDMHAPEAKRLQRCLSAVLNFAKYREDMLAQYQELRDASRATAARLASAKEAQASKHAELSRIAAERAAAAPRVAELEAAVAAAEAAVSALAEEQESLQATVRDLKAEGHDLADKLAAAKQALQATRVEADALRAKIVDAPEREEGALAEMRAAVARERARAGAADARVRELTARADTLACLEKDVRKAVALMGEAAAAVAARKDAGRVLKEARAQIRHNEADTWAIDSEREHLQRTLGTLAERLARAEQQGELKREAAMAALRGAQAEQAAARERAEATADRVAANTAAAKQLEAAMAELRRTHGREMAVVAARYATLRETVDEYHMRLAEAIDAEDVPPDAGAEKENAAGEDEAEAEHGRGEPACAALAAVAHRPGDTPALHAR